MPKKFPDIITLSEYSLLSNFTAATVGGSASGYSYSSSSDLKLWLDVAETLSDRSDQSSSISSAVYEIDIGGTDSYFTTNLGGNYTFNTAKFDDSDGINAKITYSSTPPPVSPTVGS